MGGFSSVLRIVGRARARAGLDVPAPISHARDGLPAGSRNRAMNMHNFAAATDGRPIRDLIGSGVNDAVAVIVVHGVADQPQGETAAAVATQLALEFGAAVARSGVPVHVPACKPAVTYTHWDPKGWLQEIRKSWGHALRSDFLDPQLGGADSKIASSTNPNKEPLANSAKGNNDVSPDVRFTDFLFAKAHAGREQSKELREPPVYNAARFDLAGAGPPVAVFEMFWADMSRLSGSAPRLLTELFTLLFDLVRLGGHAVSMHAALFDGEPASMTLLGRLQRWADHVYTRALAMLALQMFLCALVIFVASVVSNHALGLAYAGCAIAGVAIAALIARTPHVYSWLLGSAAGVFAGCGLARLAYLGDKAAASPLVGTVLAVIVLLLALVYARLLTFWEKRFRAIRGFGLVFGLLTAGCIAWGVLTRGGLHDAEGWMVGALRGIEATLALQMVLWCLLAGICVAIIACGAWAGLRDRGTDAAQLRQRVIRTGRFGLFTSLGIFLVFTMALWALADSPLRDILASTRYPALLLDRQAQPWNAADWLHRRLAGGTETFALIALLLSLLVGFIALVLAPCIAVEVGLLRFKEAREIGGWLTRGYRAIERLLGWGSWIVVAAILPAALLLVDKLALAIGLDALPGAAGVSSALGELSAPMLEAIVVSIAGATTGLIAIGGLAIKKLQALRAPLDAALDVDVHFREFPRDAIPRVLIAERYAALLEHVVDSGFQRIVIVAHSQGSVITADLLRYLQQRSRLVDDSERSSDRLVRLGARLAQINVDLLTLGCPLRQLYAQRFPSLYAWACDPQPQELGLRRWFNAWGSADYVGRWLWIEAQPDDNRVDDGEPAQGSNWRDLCIGPMAHTHYFEPRQSQVRRQLLDLLQAPPTC